MHHLRPDRSIDQMGRGRMVQLYLFYNKNKQSAVLLPTGVAFREKNRDNKPAFVQEQSFNLTGSFLT